jgi:hypothetical protein
MHPFAVIFGSMSVGTREKLSMQKVFDLKHGEYPK